MESELLEQKKPVHIVFDALDFKWENVPAKKYDNFMKMRDIEADPDCFQVEGYPYMLQIEPTNRCNLQCPLCPAGTNRLERERRDLRLGEFKAIIDDMEDYLLFLILWEWGEPFMHPQLPEIISYAHERDIKTLTSTNAHFLHDEEYLKRILQSGLTTLIVAIDSLEQERYEVYRKKGNLSKALDGLERLVRLKKELKSKTLINLRMVIMKQNEHELPKIRNFAKKVGVDIFTVKTLNPSCGLDSEDSLLVPADPKYRRYEYKPGTFERVREDTHCRKMWFMCSISANGDVVPCGYDYTCKLKVGNINERPLSQLWNSEEAYNLRKKLYDQKDFIPICRECSINFKLSAGGWFPEAIDFRKNPIAARMLNEIYGYYQKHGSLQQCAKPFPALRKKFRQLREKYN